MSLFSVLVSFAVFVLINQFVPLLLEMFLLSILSGDDRIVYFYQIGCHLITLILAFPVFLLMNKVTIAKAKTLFARNKNIKPPLMMCIAPVLITIITVFLIHCFIPDAPIEPPDIITGVWIVLITPVIEEIIFRGVMLQKLKRYGIIPAVIITTVLFSMGHLDIGNALVSFLPGIFLALIAIKTESIAYTVPLHMLINLCGSVILPLALSM